MRYQCGGENVFYVDHFLVGALEALMARRFRGHSRYVYVG